MFHHLLFSAQSTTVSTVTIILHKCRGTEGNTCNHFPPALNKDLHYLCTTCCGQSCSLTLMCVLVLFQLRFLQIHFQRLSLAGSTIKRVIPAGRPCNS